MCSFDEKYCIEIFERLIGIDSTTGQYEEIEAEALRIAEGMGFACRTTHKGGLIVDLGGEGSPIAVTAHLDDIGLMVRHINADGTLNVCPVGGLYPFYCVTENVRIHTRSEKIFTGSICRIPNSIHVTEEELSSGSTPAIISPLTPDSDMKTAISNQDSSTTRPAPQFSSAS